MADIKLKIGYPIRDGSDFTFHAPCDCTAVDGLIMEHPGGTQRFVFKDAHGNELSGIGNLFSTGSLVKVVLDVVNSAAVIQNADTNGYLEHRFENVEMGVTVQSKRIDELVSGGAVGLDDTYIIDNDTIHVEIRTSGAEAELTYQIKDLHLMGDAWYECYDIPLLLAPMFEPEITCSINKLTASLIINESDLLVLRFHNEDTQRTVAGASGGGVYSLAHVISPELADVRIGKDGTVYESAGAAVRAQAVIVDSAVSVNSENPVESKAIAWELQRVYNEINELEQKVDKSVSITVDSELDPNSENPIQNKAVADKINELTHGLVEKQDPLVSGENIKTINGQSILGEGNLVIGGGSGGSIIVDAELSETSENPVQNKVLTAVFNQATGAMSMISSRLGAKQDTLVSGTNIKTINGASVLGEGDITITGGPDVTSEDNGKVLQVVDGVWTAVAVADSSIKTYVDEYISSALEGEY